MHKLLAQWHAHDVADVLAQRSKALTHDAAIGFYNRRLGHVDVQPQTTFLWRAFGFAERLREHVQPGDPVVVACPTPATALSAYLAAIAVGGVPLIHATRPAFEDAAAHRVAIANLVEAMGPRTVVVLPQAGEGRARRVPEGVRVIEIDLDDTVPAPDFVLHRPPSLDSPLHYQSTSGTTGIGKLAVVTHRNLIDNISLTLARLEFDQDDRTVSWLPLYHDMGLVSGAMMSLLGGTDIHLMSPFDFLADPAAWLRTIHQVRGTLTVTPNFGLDHAVRRVKPESIDGIDLSCWTRCPCGAEPIDARTLRRFVDMFEPYGFRPQAIQPCYGLAESTLVVTLPAPDPIARVLLVESDSLVHLEEILVRRAIDLDTFDSNDVAADETPVVGCGPVGDGVVVELRADDGQLIAGDLRCGEIVVRSTSVSPGYLRPDGSISPTDPSGLRTGDIGFRHDGELYIIERLKNLIIRNGENHSASVLELEIARTLDRTLDEVVVIDSDVRPGIGRVTAIIGVDRDEAAAPMLDRLRSEADRFELPIEQLLLVTRGAIARTTSGKKQHAKVRAALHEGTLVPLSAHDLLPEHPLDHELGIDEDDIDQAHGDEADSVQLEFADLVIELDAIDQANIDLADDSQPLFIESVIDIDAVDQASKIRTIIERFALRRGVSEPFDDSARLVHDLGFDSLTLYELIVDIEAETGLDVPEEMLASLKRVYDVLRLVRTLRNAPSDAGVLRSVRELRDAIPQKLCVVTSQYGRQLEIEGRWITDFASCNYLGLDVHPHVVASVAPAIEQWGVHPSWTRAVASPAPYRELEDKLAHLVGAADVVVFPTVTLAHIGVLPRLAGTSGTIIIDRAAHNSIQEAAELAGARGTKVIPVPHDDLDAFESALQRAKSATRRVIVVDGVYSISGLPAPLPEIVELAERYDATVYVDDAHGFGILGERPTSYEPWGHRGNGVVKHYGLDYRNVVYVGGLSKAYSSLAAFVTANNATQRQMLQMSSTAVFSGPIPVASLATSLAAIEVNDDEGDELRRTLRRLTTRLVTGARDIGFKVENPLAFPIVTVELGGLAAVEHGCRVLWEQGILLTPAVFPAAPLDRGGVRFTVTSANTAAEVEGLLNALVEVRDALDTDPRQARGTSDVPSLSPVG